MDSKILKHKFLRNLYDYGFWISFRRILSYLVKPFYENVLCILYAIDLENIPGNQPSRSGLSFKLVRAEDLSLINGIEKIEEWLKGILEQKLSNNSICLAVLRDGELLGFYLATFGDAIIPLLGLRVIKRPDEAWADQITISGDHRREGLATELKRSMYAELRKRGIKTIYAATRVYNKAALESAHKFGIQKAFIFRYIKFINYRKLIYEKIHIQGGRIQKNSFSACARGVGAFQSRNDPIKSIKGPSLTQGNGGVYFFTIQTSELV